MDDCWKKFDELTALDKERRKPWGLLVENTVRAWDKQVTDDKQKAKELVLEQARENTSLLASQR